MKEIKLTQGMTALVDDDLFEELNKYKWYAHKDYKTYYAERKIRLNGKKISVKMHKVILGPKEGCQIDHVDCNGLNNCRGNLRYATSKQNSFNRRKRSDNYSGFKGVYLSGIDKKWRSRIKKDGIRISLGYFMNAIDAAQAYDHKAKEFFGEFARTNF
jgi:hypothetical protein